jgi:hypothetical protein
MMMNWSQIVTGSGNGNTYNDHFDAKNCVIRAKNAYILTAFHLNSNR